jgi:glutamate formiminotransferase
MLNCPDVCYAKTIAKELRDGGGSGFTGIRALGLAMASRGLTQVSMNITRPDTTSIYEVFAYVCKRAGDFDIDCPESEVIGAIPGFTAFRQIAETLKSPSLKPGQVLLENWPGNA